MKTPSTPTGLLLGGRRLVFGARPLILGIVNVTPDSFSDGGQHASAQAALAHGQRLVEDGADLLDIGGESTRPGSAPVGEAEELRRVLPVLEGLRVRCPSTPLSIDTSKPGVARAAVAAGASLVNDVTGFRDPQMVDTVAALGVAVCTMHMLGSPKDMQAAPSYADVLGEVSAWLAASVARLVAAGVGRDRILIDPGIGFGKRFEHNLALLRGLERLRSLAQPILLGVSRKAFLGQLTGQANPSDRALGSAVAAALVAARGAVDVLRVHDVAATRQALAVAEALAPAGPRV